MIRLAVLLTVAALLPAHAQRADTGAGVVLRAIDRITGERRDIEMPNSSIATFEGMEVEHAECRHPADNPSGDAYALLQVRNLEDETVLFRGWMIASAPALNALDHPRYDVWVLRCTMS
ncbi:DUF2155 domain-containing protein [Hasllibacter halocynthiae]|nr:DUF2155 domain-containing protein [Hasllibacter halocynthiae]